MKRFLAMVMATLLFGMSANEPAPLQPVTYEQDDVDHLLEALGKRPSDFYRILRNSEGTELRVELRSEFIIFGTDGTIRTVTKTHPATWLDDSGNPIAWLEDISALVTATAKVTLRPGQEVDVDQSGTYLLLASRTDGRTEIRRLRAPHETLAAVDGSLWKAFRRGRGLFLVGRTANEESLRLLLFRENQERLELEREVQIRRNGAHSPFLCHDLDSAGERVLVESTVDAPLGFLSSIYLADLATGTRERVARGSVVGALLLRRNPVAAE